jgi:hypothetical protein
MGLMAFESPVGAENERTLSDYHLSGESRNGRFRFECGLRSAGEDAFAKLIGRMEGPRAKWEAQLVNYEVGPRFVLVTNSGIVIAVDDISRSMPKNAIVVYLPDDFGHPAKHVSVQELANGVGVDLPTVLKHSSKQGSGLWLEGPPELDDSETFMKFRLAGSRDAYLFSLVDYSFRTIGGAQN